LYQIYTIASVLKATWLVQQNDMPIEHILLDSRKLLFATSSLFFAINSSRRNGADYVEELYTKGVRNFIVEPDFISTANAELAEIYSQANILQVPNALAALQALVVYHRKNYTLPVIGITGSNGKTIVKDWLYQLLENKYTIVRSPKSYNSQIGVPLSVWNIQAQHTLGIFEAGISQPNEMQQLQKMIAPTIGVFTNIGDAHSQGFLNIRQKVNEKLQLFLHANVLVYCSDYTDVHLAATTFAATISNKNNFTLFNWSKHNNATVHITAIEKNTATTNITAQFTPIDSSKKASLAATPSTINITIPFTDDAAIENAINCWCVLLYLQLDEAYIKQYMLLLKPIEMRLELKKGINQCSVINDSYSADINSLTIALDFLQQQKQHPTLTLILSDILQSGKTAPQLYTEVASILHKKNIQKFIGIGPTIAAYKKEFKGIPAAYFFNDVAAFKQNFSTLNFNNETILLKGARVFQFEQISKLLEEKVHQTFLEINLNAIANNVQQYQQVLQPGVRLMAMVKAFSYGTGSFEIANVLQHTKVDYLAVAYADEGVALRKAGISLPIMVMSPEASTFDNIVQYQLEPEIYSFSILHAFKQYLIQLGIQYYPIHIKIDTGMHRLGFEPANMDMLTQQLLQNKWCKVQSIFSHLVASGNAAFDTFTMQQTNTFLHCSQQIEKALGYNCIQHIANTSAIHRLPAIQLGMVRLGIGLYGVDADASMQALLKNVATLKTTIAQIKHVKSGDTIGYDRSGIANKDSVIATVRIGYADGYPRALGNGKGKMLINGQLAPVIGNVCMDMTMLDVTEIVVHENDEVIVFGQNLPVATVASWANTIAYEILAGISQRVQRVYYQE
jgi:Alr-MurF fusion protein